MAKEIQHIADDGGGWKYFAPMLHIDDDDLDPYQYRLLGHYRRVCGTNGGRCEEGLTATAQKTRMSRGKASQVRRQLAKLGRITLTEGSNDSVVVTLRDCWRENILRYTSSSSSDEQGVHHMNTSVHHMNTLPDGGCSPHEPKNKYIEQNIEQDSFASDDATTPVVSQEKADSAQQGKSPQKPVPSPAPKDRFTKAKYYPVCESKQEVYAKTYTPKTYAPLLEAWAKHGIVPVRGSVLNSDVKYAAYKLTKPPAKRNPTFDAIAECAWHMRPGFDPEILNGDGGRVGMVIAKLAEHLSRTFNEVNTDPVIAQRVRSVYAQWKVNKPNADPPKDPVAFISAWEEFTAPAPVRVQQPPAPAGREISPDERAELARKMAEQKASLFS